jgi:hypothetical protein
MILIDILALALATQAVQEAWFSGSIFETQRRAIARRLQEPAPPWWARLLACVLCTGYHVALGLTCLYYVPSLMSVSAGVISTMLIAWLAATRAVQLVHMALPIALRPEPIVEYPEGPVS